MSVLVEFEPKWRSSNSIVSLRRQTIQGSQITSRLKISQNQIDVYATDAGVAPSPANLRRSPLLPMRIYRSHAD